LLSRDRRAITNGREPVPVQLSDDGTNDLLVSDLIRTNELQVWSMAEHGVDTPVMGGIAAARNT
jgi:hypothetical protein